jgi:hypothetical protein
MTALTISDPKLSFLQEITKISFPIEGPWYWYLPTQQPMNAFVIPGWNEGDYTFGDRDSSGHFIVAGHAPFDKFPPGAFLATVESIVSHDPKFILLPYEEGTVEFDNGQVTKTGTPIPIVGFDSLEDAILFGLPDGSNHLGFSPPNTENTDGGDYGLLPLRTPPLDDPLSQGVPSIWQLTGLKQPGLQDPTKKWDDPFYMFYNILFGDVSGGSNPYKKPTAAQASEVVNLFVSMWNGSSLSYNATFPAYQPYPAGWEFLTPFGGGIQAFIAGITVGAGVFPLITLQPATCGFIAAGQLSPSKWKTDVFPPEQII